MRDDVLEALEAKIAWLEDTVLTLGKEVEIQRRQIEDLGLLCRHLSEQARIASREIGDQPGQDQRPPHY